MSEEGNEVTHKEFIENMEKKIGNAYLLGDMNDFLRSGVAYDINKVYAHVKREILEKI